MDFHFDFKMKKISVCLVMTYCKSIDKNGQVLYWRIQKNGKLKRVSKRIALKSGVVLDCVMRQKKTRHPKGSPQVGLEDLPQEILELMSRSGLSYKDMARLGLTSKRMEAAFPPALVREKKREAKKKRKKARQGSIYLLRIGIPKDEYGDAYYEYKAFVVPEALTWDLKDEAEASAKDIVRILAGEEVLVPEGHNYGDRYYAMRRVVCDDLWDFLLGPEMIG